MKTSVAPSSREVKLEKIPNPFLLKLKHIVTSPYRIDELENIINSGEIDE